MKSEDSPTDSDSFIQLTIWLGGTAVLIRRRRTDSSGRHLYGKLLVCPRCCRLWAKMLIQNEGYAHAITILCQDCEHFESYLDSEVPGSLLEQGQHMHLDWDILDYLPSELLKREFDLHIKHFCKETST